MNGERAGPSADPGSTSASAAGTPPEVDEEEEISAEREEVINAIGAFFRTADENSCIKCGQSGHAEYDCKAKGSDDVKNALNKLRDILAKKRVEAEERQEKDGAEEDQQQEREKSKHPSGKQDEIMYSTPLTLIDIGNRVHGARVDRDGPANHAELDEILNIAGENGTVMSCELAMDAPAASDHPVYKKLGTSGLALDASKLYRSMEASSRQQPSQATDSDTAQVTTERMSPSSWPTGKSAFATESTKSYDIMLEDTGRRTTKLTLPRSEVDGSTSTTSWKMKSCMTRQQRTISAPTATTRHPRSDTKSSNLSGCSGLSTRGREE